MGFHIYAFYDYRKGQLVGKQHSAERTEEHDKLWQEMREASSDRSIPEHPSQTNHAIFVYHPTTPGGHAYGIKRAIQFSDDRVIYADDAEPNPQGF